MRCFLAIQIVTAASNQHIKFQKLPKITEHMMGSFNKQSPNWATKLSGWQSLHVSLETTGILKLFTKTTSISTISGRINVKSCWQISCALSFPISIPVYAVCCTCTAKKHFVTTTLVYKCENVCFHTSMCNCICQWILCLKCGITQATTDKWENVPFDKLTPFLLFWFHFNIIPFIHIPLNSLNFVL